MRLGVGTVFHPAVERYIPDMLTSLRAQDDSAFTLVAVSELETLPPLSGLCTEIVPAAGAPVSNRVALLEAARQLGLDAIVFADADDTMSQNRVGLCRRGLESSAIVFNDVAVEHRRQWTPRLTNTSVDLSTILHGNCLGLSNTAVRLEITGSAAAFVADDAEVFDWTFFAAALAQGADALFLPEPVTHYRRHESSIGTLDPTNEGLVAAVRIKAAHYSALGIMDERYSEWSSAFETIAIRATDPRWLAGYAAACRSTMPPSPFWWECARRYM